MLSNIQSLIRTSQAIYGKHNPITFEPRTGQFLDSEGGVLDDDSISLIDGLRRSTKDGIGLSTTKRNAVLSAILREESQANRGNGSTGRGLLDRIVEVGLQYPVPTRNIFYSRSIAGNFAEDFRPLGLVSRLVSTAPNFRGTYKASNGKQSTCCTPDCSGRCAREGNQGRIRASPHCSNLLMFSGAIARARTREGRIWNLTLGFLSAKAKAEDKVSKAAVSRAVPTEKLSRTR